MGGVLGTAIVMTSSACGASPFGFEGTRRFAIFPRVTGTNATAGEVSIDVSMGGDMDYPAQTVALGTIVLGAGLTWVAGDTVHLAHVSPAWKGVTDNLWSVTIRVPVGESTNLRAVMRADLGQGRIDEMESTIRVVFDAAGIHTSVARTVREEMVRDGQRFRLGGRYAVPIDGPEYVTADEITVRPTPIKEVSARCPQCQKGDSKVTFVVFVDPAGNVHSYRALVNRTTGKGASAEVLDAAGQALRQWEFSPAKAGTRPIADWTIVELDVTQ